MNLRESARRLPGAVAAVRAVRDVPLRRRFRREFERFAENDDARFITLWNDRWPCLHERHGEISIEPHYLYHPAWAARVLAQTRPARHVDVASSIHWVAVVSAFVPIEYYELRAPELHGLSGVIARSGDLTDLPFPSGSVESLSSMHAVEHVGLGRYGDVLDPHGDEVAAAELERVLAPGGDLLFVVPVGAPRVQFNGQRVYSLPLVRRLFPTLELREFALIKEDRSGIEYGSAAEASVRSQSNACGCFWFVKPV